MPFLIEKLLVYQRALDFAGRIGTLVQAFPRGESTLGDQLHRAAVSIVANLAEGNGRYRPADRINFFRISRGSVFECVPLVELCRRRGLIDAAMHEQLYASLEEISRMLSGLLKAGSGRAEGRP